MSRAGDNVVGGTAVSTGSPDAGVASVTRIAGTVLRYYRWSRGFIQDDLVEANIFVDKTALQRAESGEARLRFYREYIGDIARFLDLGSDDIVILLNAMWVDEILADLVALTRSTLEKRDCVALLKWLWYQPEARTWLKVIFLSNPSPAAAELDAASVPCIRRHPAIQKRERTALARDAAIGRERTDDGFVTRFLNEALGRSLIIDDDGMEKLTRAIRGAQNEAIVALQKRSHDDVPKVAEMLLLFADIAKRDDTSGQELRDSLAAIVPESLSSVDRRYRGRALYLLGDVDALCVEVRAAHQGGRESGAIVKYYLAEAGDEGDGTLALQSLCSHLKFAREKKSAPLLALYLRTAHDLIISRRRKGWSPALGNLATTRRLQLMTQFTLREFSLIERNLHDAQRPNWTDHECKCEPTCQDRAHASAQSITDLIEAASKAIGFLGPQRGLRPDS